MWRLRAAALAAALSLVACYPGAYPVDIFPEMHDQPNHRRLEPPRLQPAPDAVPVTGARVRYSYDQARTLRNPVPISPATSQQASQVYAANCAACHGGGGHGDGPVAKYFQNNPAAPLPPTDLSSDRVKGRGDGELYWIVANGEGNMPAFGDELTDQQLWTVVLAVRGIQAQP